MENMKKSIHVIVFTVGMCLALTPLWGRFILYTNSFAYYEHRTEITVGMFIGIAILLLQDGYFVVRRIMKKHAS